MVALQNKIFCFNCQTPLNLEPKQTVSRQEECPQCYSNVHCCKMCQFYDASSYNECRESQANRVIEKEKANFCEYFKLADHNTNKSDKESLLTAANALFKDE